MHQSYTLVNSILGQAHYTKNDRYALKKVLKEVMVTQHKNKKIGPSQREAGIKHVLELFILKIEAKIILRGDCSMSTNGSG